MRENDNILMNHDIKDIPKLICNPVHGGISNFNCVMS